MLLMKTKSVNYRKAWKRTDADHFAHMHVEEADTDEVLLPM